MRRSASNHKRMNLVEAARKMTMPEQAVWPQRLLLALWVSVAAAFLAIFVTDLWISYPMLAAPCTGEACHYQAIGPTEAAVLAAWGLPVSAYALYILGISIVPVMLFTALATLMLLRLYPQRSKLFYSLTLIVIPVVVITSFDVVADAFPRLTIPIQLVVIVGHLLLMSLFLVFPRSRFEPRWTAVLPIFSAFFGLYSPFLLNRLRCRSASLTFCYSCSCWPLSSIVTGGSLTKRKAADPIGDFGHFHLLYRRSHLELHL
jgi:hypothetical protein